MTKKINITQLWTRQKNSAFKINQDILYRLVNFISPGHSDNFQVHFIKLLHLINIQQLI